MGIPNPGPIRVRRYDEGSAEASALVFQADAARAASQRLCPGVAGLGRLCPHRHVPTIAPPVPLRPYRPPAPVVAPASGGLVIAAVAVGIGGVLAAVGSVLPWIRLGSLSASGMDGDGQITLVLGVGLIIVGLAGATNPRRAARLRVLAAIGGLVVLGIALYELANVTMGSATILGGIRRADRRRRALRRVGGRHRGAGRRPLDGSGSRLSRPRIGAHRTTHGPTRNAPRIALSTPSR